MNFIRFIKNILSPKICYKCGTEGMFLCKNCLYDIGLFESTCPVCKQHTQNFEVHNYCKKPNIYYDKVIILSHYKNNFIKKLVKDAKFYNKKDIYEDFGFYLGNMLFENTSNDKNKFVLVDTPMFFLKKFFRGFNQSQLLCKSISENFGLFYKKNIVKKTIFTSSQSHLDKQKRLLNLKNAFKINKNIFSKIHKDDNIYIIVDDVFSTGTTLNEISKILKQNGAKKIYGLVISSN